MKEEDKAMEMREYKEGRKTRGKRREGRRPKEQQQQEEEEEEEGENKIKEK